MLFVQILLKQLRREVFVWMDVLPVVLQYSMNTETINGLRGKGNFKDRSSSENLGKRKVR